MTKSIEDWSGASLGTSNCSRLCSLNSVLAFHYLIDFSTKFGLVPTEHSTLFCFPFSPGSLPLLKSIAELTLNLNNEWSWNIDTEYQ